jgi:hypothetical protein
MLFAQISSSNRTGTKIENIWKKFQQFTSVKLVEYQDLYFSSSKGCVHKTIYKNIMFTDGLGLLELQKHT